MRTPAIALLASVTALVATYLLYWKLPLGSQVHAEFSGIDLEFQDALTVKFLYVLRNDGVIPCTLPTSAPDFFVRSRRTSALRSDSSIAWPVGLRLPPNQRLEVAVNLRLPYSSDFTAQDASSKDKTKKFVGEALSDIEGFYAQGTIHCSSINLDMPLKEINP